MKSFKSILDWNVQIKEQKVSEQTLFHIVFGDIKICDDFFRQIVSMFFTCWMKNVIPMKKIETRLWGFEKVIIGIA